MHSYRTVSPIRSFYDHHFFSFRLAFLGLLVLFFPFYHLLCGAGQQRQNSRILLPWSLTRCQDNKRGRGGGGGGFGLPGAVVRGADWWRNLESVGASKMLAAAKLNRRKRFELATSCPEFRMGFSTWVCLCCCCCCWIFVALFVTGVWFLLLPSCCWDAVVVFCCVLWCCCYYCCFCFWTFSLPFFLRVACELIVLSPRVFGLAWQECCLTGRKRENLFTWERWCGEGGFLRGSGGICCKPRIEMRFVLVFLLNFSFVCWFRFFFFLPVSAANYLEFSHVSVSTSP